MRIVITPPTTVALLDIDDTGRFHVDASAALSDEDIAAILTGAGAGRAADQHAYICVAWVRDQAGRRGAAWDERFDAMLGYARSKGWLDETDQIRAHIEYPSAEG